jgi:hypothetical protein
MGKPLLSTEIPVSKIIKFPLKKSFNSLQLLISNVRIFQTQLQLEEGSD